MSNETISDGWYVVSYPYGDDVLQRVEDGRTENGDGGNEFALTMAKFGCVFRPVVIIPAEEHKRLTTTIATQAARIDELSESVLLGAAQLDEAHKVIFAQAAQLEAARRESLVADAKLTGDLEITRDRIRELERELSDARGDSDHWHGMYLSEGNG